MLWLKNGRNPKSNSEFSELFPAVNCDYACCMYHGGLCDCTEKVPFSGVFSGILLLR